MESPGDADVALPLRASSPDIINHPSPRQRSDWPERSPPPAHVPRLEQRGINPNHEDQNANNRIDIQVGGIRDFTWDSVADLAKPTYAEGYVFETAPAPNENLLEPISVSPEIPWK